MNKKIKCGECKFVREDKKVSEKGWTAHECGNTSSPFHKALLNVTPNGEKLKSVSWSGCEVGRAKE